MIDPSQRLQFSGEVEHRLGQRGLARVHMGEDAQNRIVRIHHKRILPAFSQRINRKSGEEKRGYVTFRTLHVKGNTIF